MLNLVRLWSHQIYTQHTHTYTYVYTLFTHIFLFCQSLPFRRLRWFLILFSGSCTNCVSRPHVWLNKGEVTTETWLNYMQHYAQSCQTCTKQNKTKEQNQCMKLLNHVYCDLNGVPAVFQPHAQGSPSAHPSTSKQNMKEFSVIRTNPVWEKTEPAHRSVSAKTSLPHDAKS